MIKQRLGFGFRAAMRAQMDFDFAAVEKNRRQRVFVLRIDGRNLFVHCRFTHARDVHYAARKMNVARQFCEARLHVIPVHRLVFARRARQERHRALSVFEIKTRRRAVRIRQDFRPVDHHRLP